MQKGHVCRQAGFSALPVILGILVISGITFGYLYLNRPASSPVIQPTAEEESLKSYSNDRLGFQFQYPKNLQVAEDSEEGFNKRGNGDFRKNFTYYITYPPADVWGAVLVLGENGSYEASPFTVWVFDNANNLTIDQWYQRYWYYPFLWGDYTARRNNVPPTNEATISGKPAKYGEVSYQTGSPQFIYLAENERMYLIRIIENSEKEAEQILTSFKLLTD